MLERATRFEDVKDIRDKAIAFAAFATAAKDREMEALVGELRMRAERRAGQMLLDSRQEGLRNGKGRPKNISPGNVLSASLADLKITALESHRWQKIAFMSQDAFEQRLLALRGAGIRATTKSFLDADTSDAKEPEIPKEILRAAAHVLGQLTHFISPARAKLYVELNHLVQDYACGAVTEAIALVPARPDEHWFHQFADPVVCFIREGHFSQLKPSAVIYLGDKKRAVFARRFARLGSIWTRIPVANPEKD